MARDIAGFHVEQHGQGPAMLLTHGIGATCRMWDEQIEEFTGRHRMIVWDLPGHGQSAAPDAEMTIPSLVRRMRRFLEPVEDRRTVLVGHGIGGILSLHLADAYPERIRGLVLIGTPPALRTQAARTILNAQTEAQAAALETLGLAALEGGAEADPRLHADANALAQATRLLLHQSDAGLLRRLGSIEIPALILTGGGDRPHLSAAAYLARALPNAHEVVVPRGNHAVNIHKPDAANAAIGDFLKRLPP